MTNKTERGYTKTTAESQGNTLVVIDPRVQDYQMLARGVRPGVKVLILDDNSDGVEQITHALAKDPTESLQVVCHGAPGCLYLGKTPLDRENLSRYSQQLMEWGVAEISLYACNVAAEKNSEFLLRLHQLTNANIAASAYRVGNARKGGSWLLEYILGEKRAEIPFLPEVMGQYPGVFVAFSEATIFPVGNGPRFVSVGDFNRDGNLDLVVANGIDDNVSVLLGDGTGNFGISSNFDVGNSPESIAVADFNQDSNLDLAVQNSLDDSISILLGNGNGSFGTDSILEVDAGPTFVAVGNFNSDENADLVTSNGSPDSVSLLLGNADGRFGVATNFELGGILISPVFIAVADLNGDGNQDLVTANNFPKTVSVLLGDGTGNFGTPTEFDVSGSNAENLTSIAVADFNDDSNPDIAVATTDVLDDNISVLLGDGNGGFGPLSEFDVENPLYIAAADFDGDEKQDLVVANQFMDSISVLLGEGNGRFGSPIAFEVLGDGRAIATGDFNNDGKPDIVTANLVSDNISVLLNTTEIGPPPTIEFSQATYQVSEDGRVEGVAITIDRTGNTSSTSNVQVELSNGTATGDGIDFDNTTIPIEFAPGETSAVIDIPINDDDLSEGTENFNLTLVNALEATIGPQNTAIVSIIDNERPPVNLDIDGNGDTDALTDGLLALKYLFGSRGDALINNSIGPNAQRVTSAEIVAYLDEARSTMLDVDGNGSADALTDGLLFIRYLFGFTGDALISGAIGDGAIRTNASEIFNFLQSFDL